MSDMFDFGALSAATELDAAKRIDTQKAVEVCQKIMPGTHVEIERRDYGGRQVVSKVKMYGRNGSLVFQAPTGSKLLRYVAVQASIWRDSKRFITTALEARILGGEKLETLLARDMMQ